MHTAIRVLRLNRIWTSCLAATLLLTAVPPAASAQEPAADALAAGFGNPPMTARPRVYWFWMGRNVSRDGITADLEAMRAAGLGGLIHMAIADSVGSWDTFEIADSPTPENRMLGENWWKLLAFAVGEAGRRDLFFDLYACPGYATCGGPWITPECSMQLLTFSQVEVDGHNSVVITLPRPEARPLAHPFHDNTTTGPGEFRRTNTLYDTKGFYRDVGVVAVPTSPNPPGKPSPRAKPSRDRQGAIPLATDASDIDLAHGIDVSDHLRPDGTLDWHPPDAGRWIVYRIGHGSTGRCVHPCPPDGRGLEADKWSARAIETNYQSYAGKLLAMLDADGRKALRAVHLDSYEAGPQNWTGTFRDDFRRRRGYDPLPMLPVLSMDRKKLTDDRARRFLYDFDRTATELFAERMIGRTAELAHRDGLLLTGEPYGGGLKSVELVPGVDQPIDTFCNAPPETGFALTATYAGKSLVGAEAFTCFPQFPGAKLDAVPMTFIPRAHAAFARGINMLYFHSWAHDPFPDSVRPGMTMGQWGTQIGRKTTWWKQARPMFDYFARCQYLLQQGVRVVDELDMRHCPTSVFVDDLTVRNGRVAIADGNSFAWIRLASDRSMRPDVARRLKELVAAGAVVVGPRPDDAPGLEGYPASVEEVKHIAAELWGPCDGKKVRRHGYGRGTVLWNESPAKVVPGYVPDIQITQTSRGARFEAIHRRTPEADVYFVANLTPSYFVGKLSPNGDSCVCCFRVVGRLPELWDAADGSIREAQSWRMGPHQTDVALQLESNHSIFIVFRKPATGPGPGMANNTRTAPLGPALPTLLTLDDEWTVSFPKDHGAPERILLRRLANLAEHEQPGVRYFSGTATYQKTFSLFESQLARFPSSVCLDLGTVCDVATVRLGGHDLGILWRPPYRVDVTRWLRPGVNRLELDVTNTWVNRLIGDQQEPDDCQWYPDQHWGGQNIGAPLRALPDWFADYARSGRRPSQGRRTFVFWNKYKKDSPLPPSGLIGPVRMLKSAE